MNSCQQLALGLLLIACFIGGLGLGYITGTTYTVRSFSKFFDYVDVVNIDFDINETKMVEALMPYVDDVGGGRE